jgi:membrane protease YdiL (CAAX protease family)
MYICLFEDTFMATKQPNLVQRHPLWSFFILTYAINFSVTFFHLYVFKLPRPLVDGLAMFSPTIGALVIAALLGGYDEIRRLLSGFTRWKVSWVWYLAGFSLTGIPLLVAFGYILLGNQVEGPEPGLTSMVLLGGLAANLLRGPLGEEAGWRGFALPRLQQKHNALVSSIILGIIWAFWHVPFYFNPESGAQIPFAAFVPICIALAILFTWIYNNTRGSLLLTVLAHFFFNFSGGFVAGYLGLLPPMLLYAVGGGGIALMTIAVVLIFGPRCLSRKPESELPVESVANPALVQSPAQ